MFVHLVLYLVEFSHFAGLFLNAASVLGEEFACALSVYTGFVKLQCTEFSEPPCKSLLTQTRPIQNVFVKSATCPLRLTQFPTSKYSQIGARLELHYK